MKVGLKYGGIEALGKNNTEKTVWWIHVLQIHGLKTKQTKPLKSLCGKIYYSHFIGMLETKISTENTGERTMVLKISVSSFCSLGFRGWPCVKHQSLGIGKQMLNLCFGCGRDLGGCWTLPERWGSDRPRFFYPHKVVPMAGGCKQDGKITSIPEYSMILSRSAALSCFFNFLGWNNQTHHSMGGFFREAALLGVGL